MTMSAGNEKRQLEREALRSVIQQWNANRLDLFELSEPDESLQFHGVMRFYFQDHGQKVATKCIRVASDATVQDVIETLIEKFRPDMRMLSLPSYALYEVHSNGEERQLNTDEKPLLVQLNWHIDDREGRFLLRDTSQKTTNLLDTAGGSGQDLTFKRKLSKREKKEQKKKEKLAKLNSTSAADTENHVAEKLYTELPETSFTRSISNPEAVMRRRRQQILEKKLQQFRSRDGGPDTGGTLKIYGESLCRDVPYKTLLLSIRDCAQAVVREMLAKYGLDKTDPLHYCLVQVNSDGSEYILDDDECPLSILMNHPTSRGSIMFHVRRRPADSQPRRRKKKPLGVSNGGNGVGGSLDREGPTLVEITHSGDVGRRVKLSAEPIEVGSANTNQLQLFGPSIQPRHCLISLQESVCTVTPLHADALTFVNGHHIQQPTILHNGSVVMFGRVASYRFVDTPSEGRYNLALSQSQLDAACLYESRSPTSPSWTGGPGGPGGSSEDAISAAAASLCPNSGHQPAQAASQAQSAGTAAGAGAASILQKSLNTPAHSSSYLDAPSDQRSISNDELQQQQQQQQQQHLLAPLASSISSGGSNAVIASSAMTTTATTAGSGSGGGQPQPQMVGSGGKLGYNNNQYVSGAHSSVLSAEIQLGHIDDTSSSKQHQQLDNKSELGSDGGGGGVGGIGSVEMTDTKSVSSIKSGGSAPDVSRSSKMPQHEIAGQEPILPAVLEFPETHQELFLAHVITELDVNVPNFKLAPVYTLYLCARYRASTHYRPELQPTERAHKLTAFLHHVANLVFNIIQEQYQDPRMLSFWMANASEFLHFLKSDRHISAFSVQAQEVLAESVQMAFRNLVNCFRVELSQTLNQFLSENIDHESAAGLVLTVLGSAMGLLRRCRVNAALTIQLFSQLFHYINCVCFNTIVTNPHLCIELWGQVLAERLRILEVWALRQGLELAADCHLAKINQCAKFLMAPKTTDAEVKQLARSCFRLNSLQMAALLSQDNIPPQLLDTAIGMAESVADELTRSDGREVCLEESPDLPLALLIPDDGFSCDVVRGIPAGLVDFVTQLQTAGMCRLAAQPTSVGLWTVYMHQYNVRAGSSMSSKVPQPEVQVIKLHKNSNGMGLSIVAAKGAGQERLGIYIKSVVPGGAADADGRLQAGDQLLKVDGQSLIGITQERAADYLVRTGPVVTLEVAKQGAIFHGLATLLQQPSPVITRDTDARRPSAAGHQLPPLSYGSIESLSQQRRHSHQYQTQLQSQSRFAPLLNTSAYTGPFFSGDHLHQPYSPGGRRHSSHSHENILQMKFQPQPQIDPRYRDTRPFVKSASNIYEWNGRRDFFARRRSSSSLHDDGGAAVFHGFTPISAPQIANSAGSLQSAGSSAAASRWDVNPAIFVEEYDDAKVAELAATVKREQEEQLLAERARVARQMSVSLNEHEIPYIDDDDGLESERSEPIYVPQEMQSRDYAGAGATRKAPPVIKNRKTVSFDLVEHTEEPPANADVGINKSQTCGQITSIRFDDGLRQMPGAEQQLSEPLEPVFNGLRIDLSHAGGPEESDDHENDSLSAYFDNDAYSGQNGKPSTGVCQVDESSVALDLSGLVSGSDSTAQISPQSPPLAVPECSPQPVPKQQHETIIPAPIAKEYKPPHHSAWVPTILYDRLAFGNGKVRALRSLFEASQRNHARSSPDLRHRAAADRKANTKLSATEQQTVMRQLREWRTRRMSERDISRLGADGKPPLPAAHGHHHLLPPQLPNSKSVPAALHHVGNGANGAASSTSAASISAAAAANSNKSRSIGNLAPGAAAAAAQSAIGDQSFYQNLSVYRNQSQPNINERSQMLPPSTHQQQQQLNASLPVHQSGRPQSAYYNSQQPQQAQPQQSVGQHPLPHQHQHQHQHQHSHHQHHQQQQQPQQQQQLSGQQTMRLNAMMAPSMPNIASQPGGGSYTSQMSASQSMQNVNMINGGSVLNAGYQQQHQHLAGGNLGAATSHPHIYHAQQQQQLDMQQQQHQQHHLLQHQLHQQSTLLRGQHQQQQQQQPPLPSAADQLKRRQQQRQQEMMPMHSVEGAAAASAAANHSPLSPVKNLPPTAPKPQINRQHLQQQQHQQQQQQQHFKPDDILPPLPPTATHPLYKQQPATAAATFQTATSTVAPGKSFATSAQPQPPAAAAAATSSASPWEREEREKEAEFRREQQRHWRDAQIADIASQPHRTGQQEEQLKQLLLERDFERRAQMGAGGDESGDDDDDDEPEADAEQLRQQHQQQQREDEMDVGGELADAEYPSYPLPQQQQQPAATLPPTGAAASIQPKSILKHNAANRLAADEKAGAAGPLGSSQPASPSKQPKSASFADERLIGGPQHQQHQQHHLHQHQETIASVARDLSNLSFGQYELNSGASASAAATDNNGYDVAPQQGSAGAPPPPPPERNSSYVIMSQKQQTLRHSVDAIGGGSTHWQQQQQQQQQSVSSVNSGYMTTGKRQSASNSGSNNNHQPQHVGNQQQHYNLQQQQQQHLLLQSNGNSLSNNNNVGGGQQMPVGSVTNLSLSQMMAQRERDSNKRVSFHDEDNNYVAGGADQQQQQQEMNVIHEDSYNMELSASGVPLTPTTPTDGDSSWNSSAQPTPGVIGAQEVYRDPRARRLQEKQQQQQQQKDGEVPEKLSFKEKMKMFALESGENQTPKDKLKISRAQRDIDAVH